MLRYQTRMRGTAQEVCGSQKSRAERTDFKEKETNKPHYDKKFSMLGMSTKTLSL